MSSTSSHSFTHASQIPATAPAGGLTFTQPAQTAGISFFKIASGQPLTFGWNFTNLLSTPTHLTVSAIGQNGNTFPVGPTDGVIPGTATQIVWDAWSYAEATPSPPLAVQTYTLTIWDDRGSDAPRAPGLFQANNNLRFALYTPQPYTPIASGWTCVGCSGAVSNVVAHPAFAAFIATLVIMLVSGWSLLRNH